MSHHALLRFAPTALILIAAACNSDETAPAPDHTPVSYTVTINDNPATEPYTFTEGQTARVRLIFLNSASENLDDAESGHFASLAFNPTARATVAPVTGHHYQFDVTGGTPGSGTMDVGFGHDELADETDLPASGVIVNPAPVCCQ